MDLASHIRGKPTTGPHTKYIPEPANREPNANGCWQPSWISSKPWQRRRQVQFECRAQYRYRPFELPGQLLSRVVAEAQTRSKARYVCARQIGRSGQHRSWRLHGGLLAAWTARRDMQRPGFRAGVSWQIVAASKIQCHRRRDPVLPAAAQLDNPKDRCPIETQVRARRCMHTAYNSTLAARVRAELRVQMAASS